MHITSVGTAFPPYRYSQTEIAEALRDRWQDRLPEPRLLTRLHANCGVDHRAFVFPLDHYPTLRGFGQTNNAWIDHAVTLGRQSIEAALAPTGLTPADISAIFFTSVTGIASPTIDARLINLLPFPPSVKRTPIFGLGCVAGAAGIARATDYLRAFPRKNTSSSSPSSSAPSPGRTTTRPSPTSSPPASSPTEPPPSSSPATKPPIQPAPASSPPAPPSIATPSTSWAGTSATSASRSSSPPTSPRSSSKTSAHDVDTFLAENALTQPDIASWIFHSGGPKVLEAVETALSLEKDALAPSWKSLREHGNLSAASVLTVLEQYLTQHPGAPGSYSILAAMGPGFCLELVLLRW